MLFPENFTSSIDTPLATLHAGLFRGYHSFNSGYLVLLLSFDTRPHRYVSRDVYHLCFY
jgi:hypothetical protein